MGWNYRVVRRADETNRYSFAIHEAYYDDHGKVHSISQEPVEIHGESIDDARHDALMQAAAFTRPVLDYDKIPEPGAQHPDRPLRVPGADE